MQYWLMKTEPDAFSFADLQRLQVGQWDGVRNYAARNFMRQMQLGDLVMIYHSNVGKCCVGVARVVRSHYPDPTTDDPRWSCVDIAPVIPLQLQVSLEQIKAEYGGSGPLGQIEMIRQNRLSVVPLRPSEWARLLTLAQTQLPD